VLGLSSGRLDGSPNEVLCPWKFENSLRLRIYRDPPG
jgi:hypothetical protein